MRFEFGLQGLVLVVRQPPAGAIDQRTGRLRRIVDQGLGPVRARIVQVQCPPRRTQGRQPHHVIDRVEQFEMQHRAPARLLPADHPLAAPLAHRPCLDPAARIRHRAHTVGPQREQRRNPRPSINLHRLDKGIPGQLDLRVDALHESRARHVRRRLAQQSRRSVMRRHQRHAGGCFRHHAHTAIGHRIAQIAVLRQRCRVAPSPRRYPQL